VHLYSLLLSAAFAIRECNMSVCPPVPRCPKIWCNCRSSLPSCRCGPNCSNFSGI